MTETQEREPLNEEEATAKQKYDQRAGAQPEFAQRFSLDYLLTADEVTALLATSKAKAKQEVADVWQSGTTSRFIRVLWGGTKLPRRDIDRLVVARNAGRGVNDPPWLVHCMVRKNTKYGRFIPKWDMKCKKAK